VAFLFASEIGRSYSAPSLPARYAHSKALLNPRPAMSLFPSGPISLGEAIGRLGALVGQMNVSWMGGGTNLSPDQQLAS